MYICRGGRFYDLEVGCFLNWKSLKHFLWKSDNFDPKQKFKGDLGYKGEDLIDTPIKRPRNGKLTTDQKKENTEFASK